MIMRNAVTTLGLAVALALPAANALAAARLTQRAASKAGTEIETVNGSVVGCGSLGYTTRVTNNQFGYIQVQLKVSRTITNGTVRFKVLAVSWPVFPNHTPRSVYINQQALPLLQNEVLRVQPTNADQLANITGASATTVAWRTSLQAALLQIEKP
jgi:uncharacterized protein with FMN-binding domain